MTLSTSPPEGGIVGVRRLGGALYCHPQELHLTQTPGTESPSKSGDKAPHSKRLAYWAFVLPALLEMLELPPRY